MKYSKKQILEAISFWESKLQEGKPSIEPLLNFAKAAGIDTSLVLNISTLHGPLEEVEGKKGFAAGAASGIAATLLVLAAIHAMIPKTQSVLDEVLGEEMRLTARISQENAKIDEQLIETDELLKKINAQVLDVADSVYAIGQMHNKKLADAGDKSSALALSRAEKDAYLKCKQGATK